MWTCSLWQLSVHPFCRTFGDGAVARPYRITEPIPEQIRIYRHSGMVRMTDNLTPEFVVETLLNLSPRDVNWFHKGLQRIHNFDAEQVGGDSERDGRTLRVSSVHRS